MRALVNAALTTFFDELPNASLARCPRPSHVEHEERLRSRKRPNERPDPPAIDGPFDEKLRFSMFAQPAQKRLRARLGGCLVPALGDEDHLDLLHLVRHVHPKGSGNYNRIRETELAQSLALGDALLASDDVDGAV